MKLSLNRKKPEIELIDQDRYLDQTEFLYILSIDRAFQKIARIPGHIVEIGVARGRNAILFGHMIAISNPDGARRYFGFDTFDGFVQEDLENEQHLDAGRWKGSREFVTARIKAASLSRFCHLIEGDIRSSGPEFLRSGTLGHTPGNFRCALLYIDCNAYGASLESMRMFRPYMVPGAIICIDEKTQGGETEALIEFCRQENLQVQRDPEPFSPPAFAVIP